MTVEVELDGRGASIASQQRHRLQVRGQVQGVGFRPFVYRLARELGLSGWVRNDAHGVEIEAQGEPASLAALLERLRWDAPPLARIETIESEPVSVTDVAAAGFRIEPSGHGASRSQVAPDVAVCPACLAELFDPGDRRHRYAFINCTQCGPRYSIVRALPYDRARTSMARFDQCPSCKHEYESPAHRRFHAEPNACPACGPRLWLCEAEGERLEVAVVVAEALARIARGEIVAIKGLGGFHLACDARDRQAVSRLRARKNREEKPFAVMVANAASASPFARVGPDERALLESSERPIVLARKHPACDQTLAGVAPGLAWLGVMLPYTPLHWLLFHESAGRPPGTGWLAEPQPLVLVMTSANPGGEPLVTDNQEALRRLAGIADAFLMHDREIVNRCDDSVVSRAVFPGAGPRFVRRARGYAPRPITLGRSGPAVLACGAHLKNTVCITRGDQAFVSQHIGDLDNAASCVAFDQTVERLLALTETHPEIVVHDLHPDFYSSRFAARFASDRDLPVLAVQHHHAHVAAVLAEHGVEGEVLGLALDGVGLGTDGSAWGGELMRAGAGVFRRLGHLRALALPGGDKAAREPWRMAASVLHALGRSEEIRSRYPYPAAKALPLMLKSALHTPPTSSAGRWFDAAAGFAGVKHFASFEGQAAMLLEGLAEEHGEVAPLPGGYSIAADGELDLLPLLAAIADEPNAPRIAALFHATLVEALADWARWAGERERLNRVALGGGCFLNDILRRSLRAKLEATGFEVFEAQQVPPNDGGLSLGQAWIAIQASSVAPPGQSIERGLLARA